MAGIALSLYLAFLAVAFGWRTWLQYRRTKDHGIRALWSRAGSIERIGVLLLIAGGTLAGAAPLAELIGLVAQSGVIVGSWMGIAGLGLVLSGFTGTIVAQLQMGNSWRIGVDRGETTQLVMAGLFGRVRNPIFSGMLLATGGLLLMVPNVFSAVALGSSFLGIEIQVRRVEEPYLIRIHGDRYLSYARKVGRFCPGIGRLS